MTTQVQVARGAPFTRRLFPCTDFFHDIQGFITPHESLRQPRLASPHWRYIKRTRTRRDGLANQLSHRSTQESPHQTATQPDPVRVWRGYLDPPPCQGGAGGGSLFWSFGVGSRPETPLYPPLQGGPLRSPNTYQPHRSDYTPPPATCPAHHQRESCSDAELPDSRGANSPPHRGLGSSWCVRKDYHVGRLGWKTTKHFATKLLWHRSPISLPNARPCTSRRHY